MTHSLLAITLEMVQNVCLVGGVSAFALSSYLRPVTSSAMHYEDSFQWQSRIDLCVSASTDRPTNSPDRSLLQEGGRSRRQPGREGQPDDEMRMCAVIAGQSPSAREVRDQTGHKSISCNISA